MTRTSVVLNTAVNLSGEGQLVARRIAAAYVTAADAALFLAVPTEGRGWEAGLPGRSFTATAPRPVRRLLLEALLFADDPQPPCRCLRDPAPLAAPGGLDQAWADATGGRSRELVDEVVAAGFDEVVLFDLAAPTTSALAARLPADTRVAIVPLTSLDLLRLPSVRAVVDRADVILAATEAERSAWASMTETSVVDVRLPMRVDVPSTPTASPHRPYALALADWRDPARGDVRRREAAQLARSMPDIDVVALTDEYVYPARWPAALSVRAGGSRTDLWRWMRGSVAVVDFERHRVLGRDVIEAMACGVPVIVPERSRTRHLVELTGGGAWYRSHADIRAALQTFMDPVARAPVVRAAQAGADDLLRGGDDFGARIVAAMAAPQVG